MFVDRKKKIFPERFSNTNYPWNSFTFRRNSWDDFRVLKVPETVLQRLKLVRILGVWGSATVQYFYSDEHAVKYFCSAQHARKSLSVYFLNWFCNIGNMIFKKQIK